MDPIFYKFVPLMKKKFFLKEFYPPPPPSFSGPITKKITLCICVFPDLRKAYFLFSIVLNSLAIQLHKKAIFIYVIGMYYITYIHTKVYTYQGCIHTKGTYISRVHSIQGCLLNQGFIHSKGTYVHTKGYIVHAKDR